MRERHNRERGAVRQSILDAARELFLAEGYAHVSMRKLADQIDYSPGAIYSYFASKQEILVALAEEGLQALRVHCAEAFEAESPIERVRRAVWGIYTFSRQQPEYFSLIFIHRPDPRLGRDGERFRIMRALREDIERDIQRCIDDGLFPGLASAGPAFHILSTAICGASVFRLSHGFPPGEDPDALARDLLETTLAGLQAGAGLRFSAWSDTRDGHQMALTREL